MLIYLKQNKAYEMRISDWMSDVCSSDLHGLHEVGTRRAEHPGGPQDDVRRAGRPHGGPARRLAAAIGIQRRDRIVLAVGAAFATIEDVVGGKVDERRAGGRAGLGEEAGAVAVHRHGPSFLTLGTVDGSVGGAVDASSAERRAGKEWVRPGRSGG